LLGSLVLSSTAAGEERRISLADAITATLANNDQLYIAREDAGIAADGVSLAESAYDPAIFARAFASRDVLPGSATSFESRDRQFGGEAGLTGRLITGLDYSVSAAFTAQKLQDPFSTVYDPAYSGSLTLSATQPLLRGGWRSANRQVLVVASLRREESEQALRAQLERTVSAVEVAYWNLVRAHRERDARVASLQLAREQLEESRRLVRLGAISRLDMVEAEAGVSRRNQELHTAHEDVAEAEGVLVGVLQVRSGSNGWKSEDVLIPTDNPDVTAANESLEQHLDLARRNRPDLLAAARRTQAETAALDVAATARKPAIDLVARAGLIGFAGTLANTYATGGINQPTGGLDPPFFTDPDLEGGAGTALTNLASASHYNLYLGLRFELPLRNQEAEARYSIQHHELEKARIARQALEARVENEVRTSLNRLRANAAIVTAADEAVVLTDRLLEGTRQRFRSDASTSFDVLRILDELTRSKIEAARARARYQIALSRLAQANGTLLQRRGITLESLRRR
jgi:outer membrane protein